MQEKTMTPQASFERQIERRESLDPMEGMASAKETGHATLNDLRGLAWRGVRLSNTFLYRWLNLCEVGVEEVIYLFRMPRFFAGVDFDPVTVPHETATLDSRRLLEEHDFSQSDYSSDFSGTHSKSEISWRTPWLYLILILLVWLLLF